MMQVTGKILDAGRDMITGKVRMTFEMNETATATTGYDEMKDKERLDITVKPFRKKRSLDANAYAWVLIDRLAEKMNLSKEDIYRNTIRRIGGVSETVCVVDRAAEKMCKAWSVHGLGWMAETVESKLDGCTNIILYYGSSVYDTKQMAALIDCLVQDCQAVGIDTKTPSQIAEMLSLWEEGEKNGRKYTATG